jgi:hypothetical protein
MARAKANGRTDEWQAVWGRERSRPRTASLSSGGHDPIFHKINLLTSIRSVSCQFRGRLPFRRGSPVIRLLLEVQRPMA